MMSLSDDNFHFISVNISGLKRVQAAMLLQLNTVLC